MLQRTWAVKFHFVEMYIIYVARPIDFNGSIYMLKTRFRHMCLQNTTHKY